MSGSVTGGVRFVLRSEGACVLLISLLAYAKFGVGWGAFALFFLAPDLSLLGYLAGPRVGAVAYNFAHSYLGALVFLALGVALGSATTTAVGMIWCAHIGFDRMLGYGLKYGMGFGFTHLGIIGRTRMKSDDLIKSKPLGGPI